MPKPSPIVEAVKSQDLRALQRAIARETTIPAAASIDAARLGWQAGLAALARAGADLNASWRNYRPLHALIQEKPHEGGSSTPERVRCLTWMLSHGVDPERLGAWPSARALVIAAFSGQPEYVRALRKGGAAIDVFTAAALGDDKYVTRKLSKDASLARTRDQGVLTALHCAAGSRLWKTSPHGQEPFLAIARRLVDAGAEVGATARSWDHDVTAAYLAIRSGQVALLELLLDRGFDPTEAVSTAAWDNREDVLDLLLARGADLSRSLEKGRPILNELVRWGQFTQARMVLRKGANPNQPDERGWTALHQAASRGNIRMVEDLISAGADVDRRDVEGHRPLDIARAKPVLSALKKLISDGPTRSGTRQRA